MDRYQRVEKPKPVSPIQENEIRITAKGLVKNYVSYAISLLQDNQAKEIILKAMGQAIGKSVGITEILKKEIPNLHQDTVISSMSLTDVWEPIEEGLVPVETTRQVSMISITLSTNEPNKKSTGYQGPSHVVAFKSHALHNAGYGVTDSYVQGRGREYGRGRGRGWGRGYRGNYQDSHGYFINWGRGQMGRGRNFDRGDEYNQVGNDQGYDQRHGGGYYQGQGGFEQGQGGGFERGRRGGGYERGRRGGYEGGRGGGGYGRGGGGYERGRGGFEQGHADGYGGQGVGYEQGRGGYGRGRGRAGGRSRGGGY